MPIRYMIVGNNNLNNSWDYIRLFLILLVQLGLRQEKPDGSMYDVTANFADKFDYLPLNLRHDSTSRS